MLLMSAPLAVMAHVHLQSSIPAAGSTVKASPERLVLVFQEAVELKALSVQKVGDSAATALELPKAAAEQLAVPLPRLADGDYTISYTFVGPDEHKMSSTLKFKVSAKMGAAREWARTQEQPPEAAKPQGIPRLPLRDPARTSAISGAASYR
ncbi:MAG: copper resistance protein CopC [Proteobacteria bacterium]|nr:copper resistance protein CopC [Pseudomonadota bacterium]